MHVADAQREVRMVFLGGFMGQLVSGLLWVGSAAAATYSRAQHRPGGLRRGAGAPIGR